MKGILITIGIILAIGFGLKACMTAVLEPTKWFQGEVQFVDHQWSVGEHRYTLKMWDNDEIHFTSTKDLNIVGGDHVKIRAKRSANSSHYMEHWFGHPETFEITNRHCESRTITAKVIEVSYRQDYVEARGHSGWTVRENGYDYTVKLEGDHEFRTHHWRTDFIKKGDVISVTLRFDCDGHLGHFIDSSRSEYHSSYQEVTSDAVKVIERDGLRPSSR